MVECFVLVGVTSVFIRMPRLSYVRYQHVRLLLTEQGAITHTELRREKPREERDARSCVARPCRWMIED